MLKMPLMIKIKKIIGKYGFVQPKDLLKKDNLNQYYESVKEKRNEIANEVDSLKRTKIKDVSKELEEKEDDKASINKYLDAISDTAIAFKKIFANTIWSRCWWLAPIQTTKTKCL